MNSLYKKIHILFFIGSIRTGGKERQMIELLSYLKNRNGKYKLLVVLNYDDISYPSFEKLGIPCKVIEKRSNHKDPKLFYQFYRLCREFQPDIIHAWGAMQAFYAIPTKLLKKIPLVNYQIQDAIPERNKLSFSSVVNSINFLFSSIILANSKAGLEAYRPPGKKSGVIYNGIDLNRFENLPPKDKVQQKYGINTSYAVVMAASFSRNKDFDLFYRISEYITKMRSDITFIGAGGPTGDGAEYKRLKSLAQDNPGIIFPGRINDVEALVNACDIGVLLTNKKVHGEGIPNTVLEYMALGKPVIATDAGGTKELVRHNESGYLVTNESAEEISEMVMELIDNPEKRLALGSKGREIVHESFTLEKMGEAFEKIYQGLLTQK